MRRLGCLGSLIFYANSLVAFLLLLSFVLPYLPPSRFLTVSMLSLGVFPLIILNGLFMLYWLIRLRKQFFLSLIVLILATLNFGFFIKFDNSTSESREKDSIRLLSYNVRLFNYYEARENRKDAPERFETIVREINPDLLFIQAFKEEKEMDFSAYPYKYVDYNDSKKLFGHAIYSKYPIIDQRSEEHTSELQSRGHLVCRLLLEKK